MFSGEGVFEGGLVDLGEHVGESLFVIAVGEDGQVEVCSPNVYYMVNGVQSLFLSPSLDSTFSSFSCSRGWSFSLFIFESIIGTNQMIAEIIDKLGRNRGIIIFHLSGSESFL